MLCATFRKLSTLLPFVKGKRQANLNAFSQTVDFKEAMIPTNHVLDHKQWILHVPLGSYFFSVHTTKEVDATSNELDTNFFWSDKCPTSTDEGYDSMIDYAVNNQVESLQGQAQLMAKGIKGVVEIYESKLCSLKEEYTEQLEEQKKELEKEYQKKLKEERQQVKKELKDKLEDQKIEMDTE
ncbi:uncharacterized protein [Dysidea avara]|uniref:uncharacterized protein n=1 Tax=Dysidea avara TaxID=196820 RepID=UPI003325C627